MSAEKPIRRWPLPRRLRSDDRGVAAIEFALIMPVVALVLAATIDFGAMIFTKFRLDDAVSAAANYAMVNATKVNSSNGAALATTLANLVAGEHGTVWANSTVVVNAGPSAGAGPAGASASGSASSADSCYCPTGTATQVVWGSARTCGVSCTGGGYAGKFVVISASRGYAPLFSGFGLVSNRTMTSASIVQVQ
jgi:Flp pilus assembly protein TadG